MKSQISPQLPLSGQSSPENEERAENQSAEEQPPTSAEENGSGDASAVEDALPVKSVGDAGKTFLRESKKLWKITAPIALSIICHFGINSATQIFAGHLGNLQLSAVAVGLSVIFTFSFGFLLGMGSALETLCGQAFGAGQVDKLGVYMQRSWIILLASALLLSPLYIFATPILKLIGQQDDIAAAAGRFAVAIIPQLVALALNFPSLKFLQAQSRVGVLAWIGLAAILLHIALLSVFLYVLRWDIAGAAAAFNISQWVIAVSQIVYVMGWCRDGWTGFSWAAFRDLWAFVKLSLASAVMLCLEIWYLMVLVVLTGHLKNAEIAVGSISICMNINGWEAMIFIGINAAISVRVSNELGSGRPRATKHAVVVAVATSLVIGLFFMFVILAARYYFPILFTSDKEMQQAVTRIAYLLGITMVLNSIQLVISGVAIGGGWQGLVAYINLGCYYIFGLPLGFVLGYVLHWGVQGLWVGMLCGTSLQTLILLFIIWKTSWKEESAKAVDRVRLWGGEANPVC